MNIYGIACKTYMSQDQTNCMDNQYTNTSTLCQVVTLITTCLPFESRMNCWQNLESGDSNAELYVDLVYLC